MGAVIKRNQNKLKKNKSIHDSKSPKNQNKENSLEKINEEDEDDFDDYDAEVDVIEAANLAIAIQKEDYTTNIELSLSCENLPRMDTFSQTDPMIVVYVDKDDKWVERGRTEVIPETISPKFMKTFVVPYNFEIQQKLRFDIYDIDSFQDKSDLDKQDYIGYVETDLHEIVCSPTQSIFKTILNPYNKRRKNGTLIIKGWEFDINSSKYLFKLFAKNIASKAELFLRVFTFDEKHESVPVNSTDAVRNSKKNYYVWTKLFVASAKIVNESDHIRFELCEFNKYKGNLILGDCEVPLEKLLKKEISYLNITRNNVILGQLHIEARKIVRHTFLNYIYAGTEVSLIVGIDFSKSNKDSLEAGSLHKITEIQENDYINALKSIVSILQYYDHDNKIPVYGFGAKLPPCYQTVSQCFALNGNYFNPEVYGLEEVLQTYQSAVKNVKFHGPQIFREILQLAGKYASSEKVSNLNQKYFILLMVTNGFISDFELTKAEILKMTGLPLSIIIVGIGDGLGRNAEGQNVDYFELLQGLKNMPEKTRNIVQFVKFNNIKDDMEKIAKQTLASVPKQFLDFMKINHIEPMIMNENVIKNTSKDFKQLKIDEMKLKRHSTSRILQDNAPMFLAEMKDLLATKLKNQFNYDSQIIEYLLDVKGLPAIDYSLIYELINEYKRKFRGMANIYKTPPKSKDNESEEAYLKQKFFVKNPHVKHRLFRSRNGRNYNFYDKIKKKSENLDETKKILDMQNKRIYDTPVYEKKVLDEKSIPSSNNDVSISIDISPKKSSKKKRNNNKPSPENNQQKHENFLLESLERHNFHENSENVEKSEKLEKFEKFEKFEKSTEKQEKSETQPKQAENPQNPLKSQKPPKNKNSKIKTRILGKSKNEAFNKNYEDLFYDPLKGSLDSNLCMICQNAKIEILSLPCGHSCCCQDCFLKGYGVCLFCNAAVKNYVFIDLANKKGFNEDDEYS